MVGMLHICRSSRVILPPREPPRLCKCLPWVLRSATPLLQMLGVDTFAAVSRRMDGLKFLNSLCSGGKRKHRGNSGLQWHSKIQLVSRKCDWKNTLPKSIDWDLQNAHKKKEMHRYFQRASTRRRRLYPIKNPSTLSITSLGCSPPGSTNFLGVGTGGTHCQCKQLSPGKTWVQI